MFLMRSLRYRSMKVLHLKNFSLKELQSRGGETQISSICQFSFQMAATATAGPRQSQEPGNVCSFPHGCRCPCIWDIFLCFCRHIDSALDGKQIRQDSNLCLCITGCGLMGHAIMPVLLDFVPLFILKIELLDKCSEVGNSELVFAGYQQQCL